MARRINKIVEVTAGKYVFGGQSLCYYNGKPLFLWNVIPGERVKARIYKKKKNYLEGVAEEIIEASPLRLDVQEDHYLSCSPWQIMPLSFENESKLSFSREVYFKLGGIDMSEEFDIISPDERFGYRNKIEYSFAETEDGEKKAAFFVRGTHKKVPIELCKLASYEVNNAATEILNWLNSAGFMPLRNLKSLIIRSCNQGYAIGALFVKDRMSFLSMPELSEKFRGFQIYYSDPRSPASRPDELLHSIGDNYVESTIMGKTLKHGLLSFFQVNIPIFETVLKDISSFISKDVELLDFYSGVGAISIPLADYCKSAVLIENNEEAVAFADENIRLNNLSGFSTRLVSTEKVRECLHSNAEVIFDPPRAGLHPKLIKQVLSVKPKRIIYLSCNLSTQARDLKDLLTEYELVFSRIYNFFPSTPHVEGLCVLERK